MAGQNEPDRGLAQGLDDIEILFPGDPENPLNTLILEGRDEQIGTFEHELSPAE